MNAPERLGNIGACISYIRACILELLGTSEMILSPSPFSFVTWDLFVVLQIQEFVV